MQSETELIGLTRQIEIARALEEDIIFGRLLPGTRLVEEVLMDRFEVSRHVVRQALIELGHKGIVTRERNKGAAVRTLTAAEVHQIYQVREMLQRQAALLIPLPAGRELLAPLEELHAEFCAHIGRGYLRGVHEANDEFHLVLFGGSGNPYLVQSIKHYMDLTLPVRATGMAHKDAIDHEIMLKLLRGTDRWALAQLCVDHILPSKNAYLASLEA